MGVPLPAAYATAVGKAVECLRARYGQQLVQVVLFGSYVWGQPHADSDVDLCVVVDGLADHEARREAMGIVIDVGLQHEVPLAPLVWSRAEWEDRLAKEFAIAEDIRDQGQRL